MQRRHCECISCTAASPNAKAHKQNHEFKNLIWAQALHFFQDLCTSVKISFSPDDKQKSSCTKLEQSSALPKTSQDINQQTTLEEHKDKAKILPQSPEHYILIQDVVLCALEIFWIQRGVCVF